MRIRVIDTIGDLDRDMVGIARRARPDMVGVVERGISHGQREARALARRSAGRHGKWYPSGIASQMLTRGAFGTIVGEWGPDPSKRQGGMSFERGSRNQPAHNDIGRSRALVVPAWRGEVQRLPSRWFW